MMTDIKVPDTLKPEDTSNPVEWHVDLFWYSNDEGGHHSCYEILAHSISEALVKAESELMHNFGSLIIKMMGAQVTELDSEDDDDDD